MRVRPPELVVHGLSVEATVEVMAMGSVPSIPPPSPLNIISPELSTSPPKVMLPVESFIHAPAAATEVAPFMVMLLAP